MPSTSFCPKHILTAFLKAALSRLAISKLLSQTGLSCEGLKVVPDESVVQHARSIIESWDIGEVNPRVLDVAIDASIGIGTITYAHTSHGAHQENCTLT